MAQPGQESDLEAEYQYHRREWALQRIAWMMMILFLSAAVAGLFGDGPLSDVTDGSESQQLQYERFARHGARTTLTALFSDNASASGELDVRITRPFLDAYRIDIITPEPKRTIGAHDEVRFVFDAAAATKIVFRLEPDKLGRQTGAIRFGESEPIHVSQLVYP